MISWQLRACIALMGLTTAGANVTWAQTGSAATGQTYPTRPIRIIVPGTGNFFDIAARLYAKEISGPLGQPVIVDNRANGIAAAEITAQAPADGHTLLISTGTLWLAPFVQEKVSFDPVRDYAPITLTTRSPLVLIVHPSLPVASASELIKLARAKPGVLNYAVPGVGSTAHLAAELFKSMAAINTVQVGYRSSGTAVIDLMAGHVQWMFSVTGGVAEHVKTGRLKALAVSTAQPTALVPGLPTISATGLPGFMSVSTAGMFAPANTPVAIIHRLNQEFVRALNTADMKDRLFKLGVDGVGTTPEEFAAFIKADMARMGKVIKAAGIRAQ